jgi:hypothetical protein
LSRKAVLTGGPTVSVRESGETGEHRRAWYKACCRLGPSGEVGSVTREDGRWSAHVEEGGPRGRGWAAD